ncbi:hypothetical protein HYPBUDRAFT_114452 [Hyphopichia burtonii NRRL Y-1933]|uniref:F-box domain-containing protein n=1 Tax=Hyphopichia burtonii NRRL Y-1933 TaxID=984485 RepID=A0A1E4RD72_9ASCO|nr:hypothetical protein HYPBUDRAFT_114452 [Hyphopichia burtonii NRRL Y-1933]ODV65173.1 hypothetical protein HYPBUDRAFT_114452 [Hyphopichia burtonii NRRL Y-1933]
MKQPDFVLKQNRSYNICDLPDDILLQIFEQLSPLETNHIIGLLDKILRASLGRSQIRKQIELLITFAYRRLYKGNSLIVSEFSTSEFLDKYDTVFSFESFHDRFTNSFSKDDIILEIERKVFMETRPQSLDFKLTRSSNDYTKFIGDLKILNQILEQLSGNNEITRYFQYIFQIGFYLDANTLSVESPTSVLTAVLKTLINLVNNKTLMKDPLSNRFQKVTIKSTDIGNYYVDENGWGQLLERFGNATVLNLEDNVIGLDSNPRTTTLQRVHYDLLGNCFNWPPQLKHLSLNHNLITYVLTRFFNNLPKSIESLLLENNKLCSLGCNDNESFNLVKTLPNLQDLNLKNNHLLIFVNIESFKNVKVSKHKFKSLVIRGCNIEDVNLRQLKITANEEKFTLVI